MAIIKTVGASIVVSLAHLYNLSFSTGIFPSNMKIAKVTPIYKSDARDEFSNYRPQARTQDFLTGGYKVLKSPSQLNAARGSGGAL